MPIIKETWEEIGSVIGYSASHTRRMFFKLFRSQSEFSRNLKYWLGPGKRIKMDLTEIEQFKREIFKQHTA